MYDTDCPSCIEGRTNMHLLVYKSREDCIHHNGIQTSIALFMVVNISCNVHESHTVFCITA